jgi:CHASE2 domain-containing sensor protein
MAKNKIGKLFDKTIVWGCSLNELDEQELLYTKEGNNIVLEDNNGIKVTGNYNGYVLPTGNIDITNTEETDVSEYATAKIVDANLKAENIKNGVIILGITGTYTGETEG